MNNLGFPWALAFLYTVDTEASRDLYMYVIVHVHTTSLDLMSTMEYVQQYIEYLHLHTYIYVCTYVRMYVCI